MHADELLVALGKALDELPPADRALIEQRYFEGRSAVFIARGLGLPPVTVRTRLRRAIDRLRKSLDDRYGGDRRAWMASVAVAFPCTPRTGNPMNAALLSTFVVLGLGALVPGRCQTDDPETPLEVPVQPAKDARVGTHVVVVDRERASASDPVKRAARWTKTREELRTRLRDFDWTPIEVPPMSPCEEDCALGIALSVAVGQAVSGCPEVLAEDRRGVVRLQVDYLASPEIGAVVDRIEIAEDTLGHREFAECLRASAYLAELPEPTRSLKGSLVARYTLGPRKNNIAQFLEDHPDLIAHHDALAAVAGGEAPTDEQATAVARLFAANPALQTAFAAWIETVGLELSLVHPG